MIKQTIDSDLKQALLSGDKELTSILRTLKGVILDAEISTGSRGTGLPDEQIITLLQKESKKRLEASKIYENAGDQARAKKEIIETEVISKYLPKMMNESEVTTVVEAVISEHNEGLSISQMGQIIGKVKSKCGSKAEGSMIARIVKAKIDG